VSSRTMEETKNSKSQLPTQEEPHDDDDDDEEEDGEIQESGGEENTDHDRTKTAVGAADGGNVAVTNTSAGATGSAISGPELGPGSGVEDMEVETTEEKQVSSETTVEKDAEQVHSSGLSGDADGINSESKMPHDEVPTKKDEGGSTVVAKSDLTMEVGANEDAEKPTVDAASVDVKADDAANDTGTDDASSKDLPYSTRGRSTGSASGEEKLERVAPPKETFEEPPRPKESGVSFLESLSEEERRTRTRFLPDVEGMHTLRKNEIKEDMAMARSLPTIATSQNAIQTRTVRLTSSGRRRDAMLVDGDDTNMAVQDDRTTTIHLPTSEFTVPSDAFVAPEGVVVGETEGTVAVKEIPQREPSVHPPSIVESVTAFNPPRPPESVGPKKKHRVIRWERRPEDIEVDMINYRRTVQRTREELQKSEAEYDRLETIDAHLRRHFMSHLEILNGEYKRLHDEMQIEVQKLMKESELVGSRTRSRNLTKVSVVMRDVLNSFNAATMVDDSNASEVPPTAVPGVGGLNAQAFQEWDRFTDIKPMKPAISWIEPGQKVVTLYGEGTVMAVFPPESPEPSPAEKPDAASTDCQRGSNEDIKNADFQKSSNRKRGNVKNTDQVEKKAALIHEQNKYNSLKPVRVQIRLKYGVGVFGIGAILSMDSPANFSDAKLARRWRGMIDSALKVGPCIDVQGMASKPEKQSAEFTELAEGLSMDIDDAVKSTAAGQGDSSSSDNAEDDKFLPLGASLFPTKFGRGSFLHEMTISDIEKGLQRALYDGHGVLGEVCCAIKTNGCKSCVPCLS
jgi:hypothetical protein